MQQSNITNYFFLLLILTTLLSTNVNAEIHQDPVEIVKQCENVNHGKDHVTTFSVKVINRFGQERQSVYKRYWKYFGDKGSVREKMTLFALAPADARNTAFMKISYDSVRNDEEQWLYMPNIRSLRAISRRDRNDSFLGTDLTYGDISYRRIEEDVYKLLNTRTFGRDIFYLVESTPKESDSQYKRKVTEYQFSDAKNVCLKNNIHYYDHYDKLLKTQDFTWQEIDGVWLWDKVIVKNVHALSTSIFQISNPSVNTDLSNKWFTKRMLKRGI